MLNGCEFGKGLRHLIILIWGNIKLRLLYIILAKSHKEIGK